MSKKKIRIPILRLRYKVLLYAATVCFAALSLLDVICSLFPMAIGVIFYVLAAVSLTASCYYLAVDLRYGMRGAKEILKPGIEKSPFAKQVVSDYRYRTVLFAVVGLILNIAFTVFNGFIGIRSRSAWYVTLAVFNGFLSLMRFAAIRYEWRGSGRQRTKKLVAEEIAVYRFCGILLIIMTIALAGAVVLLVHSEGGKTYPGYTIFLVAMYTFYKIIAAVIHVIKARKMRSPLLMAIRSIGYVNACVSLLFLQTAMFASFGDGIVEMEVQMNGITGAAVCMMSLAVGIHCIISAAKMRQQLEQQGRED